MGNAIAKLKRRPGLALVLLTAGVVALVLPVLAEERQAVGEGSTGVADAEYRNWPCSSCHVVPQQHPPAGWEPCVSCHVPPSDHPNPKPMAFADLSFANGRREVAISFGGKRVTPPPDMEIHNIGGRTYASLRWLAELLGLKVDWRPEGFPVGTLRKPDEPPLPGIILERKPGQQGSPNQLLEGEEAGDQPRRTRRPRRTDWDGE